MSTTALVVGALLGASVTILGGLAWLVWYFNRKDDLI